MPRKVREPFAFSMEDDGSTSVFAYPVGRRAPRGQRLLHTVGYVRSASGGVLSSLTFEEMQDYSQWDRHDTLEDALRSLTRKRVEGLEAADKLDDHEANALVSLNRSAALIDQFSFRAKDAMVFSARRAVVAAVADMLRLTSYDEVMVAVSEALASDVMGG